MDRPGVALVVVTHQSASHLDRLAQTLLPQIEPGDELVIVDNASTDGTLAAARRLFQGAQVVDGGANLGFSGGAHVGVGLTRAPLLLFLNPDCELQPGLLARLRDVACSRDWGAWQATVLTPNGRVSSTGGVVHYLGIGWADDSGASAAELPVWAREVAFPSGAAMMVRRSIWDELGGLDANYFLYGEDLDLGLRLWLSGYAVGSVPDGRIVHEHEFEKGSYKWFYLERNRWRTILSVYPLPLLVLLSPALLAAEVGLLLVAARQGWLRAKLRAQLAIARELRRIVARRRVVQRTRRISVVEFAGYLTASLDSPFLAGVPRSVVRSQSAYWSAVKALLASSSSLRTRGVKRSTDP